MIWYFVISILFAMLVSIAVPIGLLFEIPLSILAFFVSFFFAFYFLTRSIIQYFLKLAQGLAAMANGNLDYRIPSIREDELGIVANNINWMAEKLERQIEKERQDEKSKMELITGVSHDLRTPLTSIIGYLELLETKAYHGEAEYERFVSNTYNKAMQLKKLIDDLFEYTRLTSGIVELHPEEIDLREMLNQMLVEFEPIVKDNGVTLESALLTEPVFLRIDPEKIRRAVDNLLMNALKFTVKPGTIRVSLVLSRSRAMIVVENEGKPIRKEQEEQLFDRFYKVDDSRSGERIQSGAGLGLSIARSIVELHGGTLHLIHHSGRFQFYIALPFHVMER